jgi:hypothetical protein
MGQPDPNYDDGWRERPEAQAALGPVGLMSRGHPHLFPNLWFATGPGQLSLRLSRGPYSTEMWWFTVLVKEGDNRTTTTSACGRCASSAPPAGSNGENWGQSTKGLHGYSTRNSPINYAMGLYPTVS